MKKQLAVIATFALLGGFAKAEDKGTEFKFGGELLQRYQNTQDANLQSGAGGSTGSQFLSRNQFHVNAISSDKLQAYFDFIHTAVWGGALGVPANAYPLGQTANGVATNTATTSIQNALQISEAWLWWKVSDMFSLRSGRQGMDYGDGLVFSKNDWLATPYTVDAAMGRFGWDFMDLDVGAGTIADLGINNALTGSSAGNTDVETVFYGFYAQFKNLPDIFKHADLFLLQVNEDAGLPTSSIFTPGYAANGGSLGLTSVGIHLKGDFNILDWRLDGVYQTGKQNKGVGLAQDVTFGGNMVDVEVGANFPEFMKGRVFVNYHRDSGNDSTDVTKNNAYQPLFYDRHTYAGLMDNIGFGNLTDIRLGGTIAPMEDTTFGLGVDILSRTSTPTGGNGQTTWLTPQEGNLFSALGTTNNTASDLGTQFAVNATHNYGHGFSVYAQASFWTPGGYFKPAGVSLGSPWQFIAQAKYAF